MNDSICRICGTCENGELKYILDGGEIMEMLLLCTNISIADEEVSMPKHICSQCESGLVISYRLRKQGEETEKKLKEEALKKLNFDSDAEHIVITVSEQKQNETDLSEELEDDITSKLYEALNEDQKFVHDDIIYVDDVAVLPKNEVLSAQPKYDDYTEPAWEPIYNTETLDYQDVVKAVNEPEEKQQTLIYAKNYTCETCQQAFYNQTEYRQHIKQHGSERFNCIQCNKWFPTKTRLSVHVKCHVNDVEMHKCLVCDHRYRGQNNLKRHIRSMHDQRTPFICPICNTSFGRADVFKRHKQIHDAKCELFDCESCKKSFNSCESLCKHMKTHNTPNTMKKLVENNPKNTDKKKIYNCAHCGKISNHSFTHKNHMRIHTLERPYACETCQKRFRTLAALTIHERIHNGLRPYQCEHCLVSFRQQAHLKEHKMRHAGIMPHVCTICKSAFTKKCNLTVHMRTHSDERPYICHLCTKQCSKLTQLKRHLLSMHKIKTVPLSEQEEVNNAVDSIKVQHDNQIIIFGDSTSHSATNSYDDEVPSALFSYEHENIELAIDEDEQFSSLFMINDITS